MWPKDFTRLGGMTMFSELGYRLGMKIDTERRYICKPVSRKIKDMELTKMVVQALCMDND